MNAQTARATAEVADARPDVVASACLVAIMAQAPAWIDSKSRTDETATWANAWTRNVLGPGGDLALIQSSDATAKVQIANLHGDVVTEIDNTATYAGFESYAETTEYGLARNLQASLQQNYGWLGANRRSTDTAGGMTLMGVRLYNPATGRFLSTDPIAGGNDNTYIYPADPINKFDLTGEAFWIPVIIACARYCSKIYKAAKAAKAGHKGFKFATKAKKAKYYVSPSRKGYLFGNYSRGAPRAGRFNNSPKNSGKRALGWSVRPKKNGRVYDSFRFKSKSGRHYDFFRGRRLR